MKSSDIPFNIDLLVIPPDVLKMVRPTTSLDIYDGATKNFHKDGLYSTEIYGVVGTDARYIKYSWINIKVSIIHPIIFKALGQIKSLYLDILSGREFAVFDKQTKDFVKSNALEGQTGYQFFIDHFKEIQYQTTPSQQRQENIKLIKTYQDKALLDKIYVIPAGYRDIEIDDNGRESSDEVNSLYYKLLATANTINEGALKAAPEAYNGQRMGMQNTFNQIYDAFLKLVEGKSNLFMGKWASRKIFNTTRNVITAMDTTVSVVGAPGNIGINDTAIGIFQYLKGILPVARTLLRNGFLSEVFSSPSAPALLVNKKTLESERVHLSYDIFDRWMTNEGIEKLINIYREPSVRDEPIVIYGYYLGLTYRGPDGTFKLIHGISDLPEGRSAEHCTPTTFTEFFYASVYQTSSRYPMLVTRYPIESDRSTYPSKVYLKSTIKAEIRKELGMDWKPIGDTHTAYQFPMKGSSTFDSQSPHPCRLSKLKADFDGDTSSGIILYSEDSIKEVDELLKKKSFYVGSNGQFTSDLSTDTITYVLHNLTGE
jgi:hypothetical protein